MQPAFRKTLTGTLIAAGLACATHAFGAITFYENDGFTGRALTAQQNRLRDLSRLQFNDRTSSIVVTGNRWEVCEGASFEGRCVVLRPGQYASMRDLGLNDALSSARMVFDDEYIEDDRYAALPEPPVVRDFRRRPGERVFTAQVTNVRAVMGQPEQRCWVEQQAVPAENRRSVPGGVAGAVIGGILGHQIGGGSGRDLATVGGVVGGAVIGSRVGARGETRLQDVQRCETVSNARPAYYDVTYVFRGVEHHAQLMTPPANGRIVVNNDGEPRA